MEQEKKQNTFRTYANMSSRLKSADTTAYKNALSALKSEAEKASVDGTLYVLLADRGENFSLPVKTIKAMMELDSLYSLRNIQNNPALATEYAEIGQHMKEIERIINKRKKSLIKK